MLEERFERFAIKFIGEKIAGGNTEIMVRVEAPKSRKLFQ